MKKKGLILVVLVFLLSSTAVFAANVNGTFAGFPIVNVNLNGEVLKPSVPGIVLQGSTLLPVRSVAESLNALVSWDQTTMTAKIIKPEVTMCFVSDVTENADGTWDLIGPYEYSEVGIQGEFIIFYEFGSVEPNEYEYRIVAKDPSGDILNSSISETFEVDKYGVRGYTTVDDLVFKSPGNYKFDFQIKFNGEFKTVESKTLLVE